MAYLSLKANILGYISKDVSCQKKENNFIKNASQNKNKNHFKFLKINSKDMMCYGKYLIQIKQIQIKQ